MKKPAAFFLCALLLTAMSLLVEYQYCVGGPACGLPFAILKPSHGEHPFAIQLEPHVKIHGQELDLGALFFDLGLYLLLSWFGWRILAGRLAWPGSIIRARERSPQHPKEAPPP